MAHHWEKVFAEAGVRAGYSVLSQAFADNAHTGKVYDLALFKVSSAWTIGMSLCLGDKDYRKGIAGTEGALSQILPFKICPCRDNGWSGSLYPIILNNREINFVGLCILSKLIPRGFRK